MAPQPFVGPLRGFLVFYLIHSRYDSLDGGSVRIKAATCTYRTPETQNKCTQTFMPRVVFEPTIQVLQRVKTVHALDSATTVIGK
jgi:hypothetical protein